MTWRGSTTVQERIFACLPYLLPLMVGYGYGESLFLQFPPLGEILRLLLYPVGIVYSIIPFASLVIFFGLLFLVVRNERIPHFIRFNTMQAILLEIGLMIFGLILSIIGGALQGFLMETISNTLFLGVLVAVVYSVVQSLMGRYAEIPAISDAVYMQVR